MGLIQSITIVIYFHVNDEQGWLQFIGNDIYFHDELLSILIMSDYDSCMVMRWF